MASEDINVAIDYADRNQAVDVNPYIARTSDDNEDAFDGSERESFVSKPMPQADDRGNLQEAPPPKKKRSIVVASVECFKYIYSMALLAFCVTLVMASIFNETSTAVDYGIPPIGAFFLFWFLICWLAMMEGGQGCLVGLQAIDKEIYADTHPKTLKNTIVAHEGDNMERFIVGRQFLNVLVIFLINLCGSALANSDPLGLPKQVNAIFLDNGVAMMITTIVLGQLTSQMNAAVCMLDFVNNYFMLFTTYVSLGIEYSGLLHSVYLVQYAFATITGNRVESNRPPRNFLQNVFFWARVLFSSAVLSFALAVTIQALLKEQSGMWEGVPSSVSILIFFVLLAVVGLMEGMQIASFALINMSDEELQTHKVAAANCKLMFEGQNLQAFLIGRQIFVASLMFIVARIATIDIPSGEENIFGVSNGFQSFLATGLLGAVVLTIVGSLVWRIIASSYPLAFMSNPAIYVIIRMCLLFEALGICSSAWVLARFNKILAGYQPDEVYLEGTDKHGSEPVTRRDKDIDMCVTVIRYTYSLVLLLFCVLLVMACIFDESSTAVDYGIPPIGAFFLFWFLICWLAMAEGGQGCLVGLQPIPESEFSETHEKTLKNTNLIRQGDNMERFILGRQFLVVLIIFLINLCGSAVANANPLQLPSEINAIFLDNGVAMMITTIVLGQLISQVNAAVCMLDFINNYFMLFTAYVSLGIEYSGLLHSAYLVQIVFSKLTGNSDATKGPPRNFLQNVFFWARVLFSSAVLSFALAVTIQALLKEQSGMWEGVPSSVSILIFFVLLCVVGLMEGMQIAAFALINMSDEELQTHKVAYSNCKLMFSGNLQAFLIGRQIFAAALMFIVARIATIDIPSGEENIFGVSNGFQNFLDTGLLGAVVLTIVGSLVWRIIASSYPLAFMSNPAIYVIIKICFMLEKTGICSSAWVLARFNKILVGYQPDEVYLDGAEKHGSEPVTRRDKDIDITVTVAKYSYSTAILIFCISFVMSALFSEKTTVAKNLHPVLAFLLFWFLICWLAMMEGGQGCLVGLQAINRDMYASSHPRTLTNTIVAHEGDNMERFIIGRQFLVVLVIFLINTSASPIAEASALGFEGLVTSIFLDNGVAIMVTTIILGQLTTQVNAAVCMLDFINNYFMLFTTCVSLGIEYSGLLHSVYLVQIGFSKLTGNPIVSKEAPRSGNESIFFWLRVLVSSAVLSFALAVTIQALLKEQSGMWTGVPASASIVIFFTLLCVVGLMEGMQIAAFALLNIPRNELDLHAVAAANCNLIFSGNNLQAFLIGRQIFVASLMFIVARIASIDVQEGEENIFGVSTGVQKFFDTGLLGAVVLTIIGSLIWRIIASSYPLAFMSNPLSYVIIRICMLLEGTGICSAAWFLALIHRSVAGYQIDEVYLEHVDDPEMAIDRMDAIEEEVSLVLRKKDETFPNREVIIEEQK